MVWSRATYDEIKQEIRPGDVIAFGGKGGFAGVIKWATLGTVNHVAVVLSSEPPVDDTSSDGPSQPQILRIRIMESTSALDEFPGVNTRDLQERIEGHEGEVWWLPLDERTREKLDVGKFHAFLERQVGKPYDSLQAPKSALDDFEDAPLFGRLAYNPKDHTRFFCSELVAAGLEAGGAISSLNYSEVTPMDLCSFFIYQDRYYQLKGSSKLIEGYNLRDPEGWGEIGEPVSFKQNIYRYPVLLGLLIGGALLLGLFLQGILLDRFTVIYGPQGSARDLRLAMVHCLLAGYLPAACLYLLRSMKTTSEELIMILRGNEEIPVENLTAHRAENAPAGRKVLLLAGLSGMLVPVLMPLLTAETAAWDPSTWNPEVWWHRLLGLFIGWWLGWFVLTTWYTSAQTSQLAAGIRRLDLLDLSSLTPLVKQGLLTSALIVGALSLTSLFLLEPGQWPAVVIIVALALPVAIMGLLLPMRGVHRRIRKIKAAELEWTRERIRRASSFVYQLKAAESPGLLADLCAYSQLIENVSEWPFQASALVQVALYMLIPVFSWLGSLLIEGMLDRLLG